MGYFCDLVAQLRHGPWQSSAKFLKDGSDESPPQGGGSKGVLETMQRAQRELDTLKKERDVYKQVSTRAEAGEDHLAALGVPSLPVFPVERGTKTCAFASLLAIHLSCFAWGR